MFSNFIVLLNNKVIELTKCDVQLVQSLLVLVIAFVFASYCFIIRNFDLMPFMILSLGAFMLVTGLVELQKDRRKFEGYMCIVASLFIFFVSIQGFLFN